MVKDFGEGCNDIFSQGNWKFLISSSRNGCIWLFNEVGLDLLILCLAYLFGDNQIAYKISLFPTAHFDHIDIVYGDCCLFPSRAGGIWRIRFITYSWDGWAGSRACEFWTNINSPPQMNLPGLVVSGPSNFMNGDVLFSSNHGRFWRGFVFVLWWGFRVWYILRPSRFSKTWWGLFFGFGIYKWPL